LKRTVSTRFFGRRLVFVQESGKGDDILEHVVVDEAVVKFPGKRSGVASSKRLPPKPL